MSKSSTSLCPLCRSISLAEMRGPNLDRMQPHQPSYLALKNSASDGCQLCAFIWKALARDQYTTLSGQVVDGATVLEHVSDQYPGRQISLVPWGKDTDGWSDRITIITTGEIPDVDSDEEESKTRFDSTMHPDFEIALSGVLDLFAHSEDPAASHGEVRGRPLPTAGGDSDEDFRLAKRWIDDCLCSHDHCRKTSSQETRLPTRVLDIGPADGCEEPYLLETNGLHGSYIALSHCWGGQVPLTTTSETISERTTCIPLVSLPKTFRDAVTISRRIGVRYLWIDSLCIIQDSRTNWENKSAVMGDVYGRSFLTIAARGARNADVGCFIPRKEEPPTCCLEYCDGEIKGQMYIREPAFEPSRSNESTNHHLMLYWECTSSTIRQDGKFPDVDNDGLHHRAFKESWDPDAAIEPRSMIDKHTRQLHEDETSLEKLETMSRWYDVVHEYTRRNLTYESDKLPAIAGVAKQFHRKTGFSYIAGLWKEDLITGLLWLRSADDGPISSKLPTWSWARFGGEVRFWSNSHAGLKLLHTECELIDLSYDTTDTLHKYGEVANARIVIKGRISRAILKKPVVGGDSQGMTLDTIDGVRLGWPKFDALDTKHVGFECFCVFVHHGHQNAGLLLEKVEGRSDVYRRVGYVAIAIRLDERNPFPDITPQVFTII